MAKTALTLEIEKLLYSYQPDTTGGCAINKFRPRHIGYEVPVSTGTVSDGLIDCVRVDEILVNGRKSRGCNIGQHPEWYRKNYPQVLDYVKCKHGIDNIDDFPPFCEETSCNSNCLLNNYDNEICITCYEIKVSKSDFHSAHGHNFCGNANYYVMPDELYKQVKLEVPEDIGVIVYKNTDKYIGLRRVKECQFKHLDNNTHRWMILNVLKKHFSYASYNTVVEIVKYLHNMIERCCATCDYINECTLNHSDRAKSCIVNTKNPEHNSYWECKDSELRLCGVLLDDNNIQEGDLFA